MPLVLCGIGAPKASAYIVDLDVMVLTSLLNCDGNPLADGSIIMVIGSYDSTIDPMQQHGSDYIANSTTGDDFIIGTMTVDTGLHPYADALDTFQVDDSSDFFIYIRVFDSTGPLTGEICWGTSIMTNLYSIPDPGLGGVYYFEVPAFQLTNKDTFVVIPEPSTANLLLLMGGMTWAIRANTRRKKKRAQV